MCVGTKFNIYLGVCVKNNVYCVPKVVGFVYASMGLNIKGLLMHVTIRDFISAVEAWLPCKTLVESMSVVLACKIILQIVNLNSIPGTDLVGICSVSLWWNTIIEIKLLGCSSR
jgi:hypothetical protein